MSANEWLANLGWVPDSVRSFAFHPGETDKPATYAKYPTAGAFFENYGFKPSDGWYDPQTGAPIQQATVAPTNVVDPNAAAAFKKGFVAPQRGKKPPESK